MVNDEAMVGRGWRRVFLLEVPICLASALYWLACPDQALATIHGIAHADPVHVSLLAQLAFVVLAVFVWFYGRWLGSGRVQLRPFRYLQEGLILSDGLLIWAAIASLDAGAMQAGPAAGQITMAGAWLAIRVAFLITTTKESK